MHCKAAKHAGVFANYTSSWLHSRAATETNTPTYTHLYNPCRTLKSAPTASVAVLSAVRRRHLRRSMTAVAGDPVGRRSAPRRRAWLLLMMWLRLVVSPRLHVTPCLLARLLRFRPRVLRHTRHADVACVLRQVLRLHPPWLPLGRRAAMRSVTPRLLPVPLRHRLGIEAAWACAGRWRRRAELRPVHAPQRRRQLLLLVLNVLCWPVQVVLTLMGLRVQRQRSALQLRGQ